MSGEFKTPNTMAPRKNSVGKPLPDINEVRRAVQARLDIERARAGLTGDDVIPSFDQMASNSGFSLRVILRCETILMKLQMAMLQRADESEVGSPQWLNDMKEACDFILDDSRN